MISIEQTKQAATPSHIAYLMPYFVFAIIYIIITPMLIKDLTKINWEIS
jgi:hypothetical protein